MALKFNNCEVIINGSKILAENAYLSEETSINPSYVIGYKNPIDNPPTNGLKNSLQLNYLMEVNNEPNYPIITGLKESNGTDNPIVIGIAGISGSFYLDSYSFSVVPNNLVRVNASYTSFENLTGNLTGQSSSVGYNSLNNSGLAHYWTTLATKKKADITSGLLGWWKLDENTEWITYDSSNNGHSGLVTGATWVTGIKNSALLFTGLTDRVNIPHSTNLDNIVYSLSLWMYPYSQFPHSSYGCLISKGAGFGYGSYKIATLGSMTPNSVIFYVGWDLAGFSTSRYIQFSNSGPNKWTFITCVYDGISGYAYTGGKLVNSKDLSAYAGERNCSTTYPVTIGNNAQANWLSFTGKIDDVRVYNRVLSPSEIEQMFIYDETHKTTGSVIALDYNFKPNWEPVYTIGKTNPCQVSFTNAQENINVTTEILNHIKFSGQNETDFFNDFDKIEIKNISTLWNNEQNHQLTFLFDSGVVTSNKVNIDQNNIITVNTTINKYY